MRQYCKFCEGVKIVNHPDYDSTFWCENCKTRYYGFSYRIVCEHEGSFYWFHMDHLSKKTYMFRKRAKTLAGDKIAEWDGILDLTPFNIEKRIKTLITFG